MASYISDYLHEGIQNKNIREIRKAILAYIEIDPACKTKSFDEAVKYAEDRGFTVYEPHDPKVDSTEGATQEEKFYMLQIALSRNFSKERVQKIKALGRSCMQNANVYNITGDSLYKADEDGHGANSGSRRDAGNTGSSAQRKKSDSQDKRVVTIPAVVALLAVIAILAAIILIIKKNIS